MTQAKQIPHFNQGKRTDIAFIFSCPGQDEEKAKRPVSGRTGENLEVLLKSLKKDKRFASFNDRYDFRITNASNRVHYETKTGRSEELDSYLSSSRNLARLSKEIADIDGYVICFGSKPEKTIKKLLKDPKYNKTFFSPIYTKHLSIRSLNSIDVGKTVNNKTEKRLKILAKKILNQMKKR